MTMVADLLTGKIPPHNFDAERAVLGGLLLDWESLPKAIELLNPFDFYKEGHRKIFAAMEALFERNTPTDLITVSEELRRRSELDEIGGPALLGELVEVAATAANLLSYGAIVREKAVLRELIRITTDLIDRAYKNGSPPVTLVETAQRQLESLAKLAAPASDAPIEKVLSGAELFAQPISRPDWPSKGCSLVPIST
jgi:replicative DNA helicase